MKLKNGFHDLNVEFEKDYFLKLKSFLDSLEEKIYPPKENIFKAFDLCDLSNIKVVILGQDPYHQPNQANGLAFSVNKGTPHPRSLRNILKEVSRDCDCKYPKEGNLTPWAKQGVFLLNTILTVSENKPSSHKNKGWEIFTDRVIEYIDKKRDNIVFILWGNYAQTKENLLSKDKHLILSSSHPSPFSARLSFNGCSHFSSANDYLIEKGHSPINWCLE
ncbi:MAG: uracil-DNA glycosylase [Clostridia bacterium]